MEQLPDELIGEILDHSTFIDRIRFSRTCRRMKELNIGLPKFLTIEAAFDIIKFDDFSQEKMKRECINFMLMDPLKMMDFFINWDRHIEYILLMKKIFNDEKFSQCRGLKEIEERKYIITKKYIKSLINHYTNIDINNVIFWLPITEFSEIYDILINLFVKSFNKHRFNECFVLSPAFQALPQFSLEENEEHCRRLAINLSNFTNPNEEEIFRLLDILPDFTPRESISIV